MSIIEIAIFTAGALFIMWIIAMSALWENRKLMWEIYYLKREIASYRSVIQSNRTPTNEDKFNAAVGKLAIAMLKAIFK